MIYNEGTLEEAQAAMRARRSAKQTDSKPNPKRKTISQKRALNKFYCRNYYNSHLGKERAERRAEREAAKQTKIMAARQKRKKRMAAKRWKRWYARKKAEPRAKRRAECAAFRAQCLAVKLEKERQLELKRRKHASRKEGFLAGWGAKADLTSEQEAEWGTRYKNGFKYARSERMRFEAHLPKTSQFLAQETNGLSTHG